MFLFSVVECVFVLVASLFPCALSWSQVDLFFIVWGLGDGFVNDTAGKAISAEGQSHFFRQLDEGAGTLFGLMTLLLCFLMIWAIFSAQL